MASWTLQWQQVMPQHPDFRVLNINIRFKVFYFIAVAGLICFTVPGVYPRFSSVPHSSCCLVRASTQLFEGSFSCWKTVPRTTISRFLLWGKRHKLIWSIRRTYFRLSSEYFWTTRIISKELVWLNSRVCTRYTNLLRAACSHVVQVQYDMMLVGQWCSIDSLRAVQGTLYCTNLFSWQTQ